MGTVYTVGKVNGDHWLLYLIAPADMSYTSGSNSGTERVESESLSNPIADIQLSNREKTKAKAEAWAIVGDAVHYSCAYTASGLYHRDPHDAPQRSSSGCVLHARHC